MTLKEVNYEVETLNNKLNKYINDKLILESLVKPQSVNYEKVLVDGGNHCNKLEIYILKQDVDRWRDLDKKIIQIQGQIKNNMDWIANELKILKKYEKTERLIVYYKEEDLKEYSWHQISAKVDYSVTQCRRIYSRYKKKRNL